MSTEACRCTSVIHDEHAGGPCTSPATESDGYCKACHDHAAREWAQAQPVAQDDVMASLIAHRRHRAQTRYRPTSATGVSHSIATASGQVIRAVGIPFEAQFGEPQVRLPSVLIQATVVRLGNKVNDGHLIEAVSVPWFEIIRELERNPDFLFQIPWRKLEEIIAGAYERDGWPEVVLTPRSGDQGRDVIATKPGFGSVRIIDQVKAYSPGHPVTANDVRAVLGVLYKEHNVSKGVVTTSSTFAPGILKDPEFTAFMPHRLELKDGEQLLKWLKEFL